MKNTRAQFIAAVILFSLPLGASAQVGVAAPQGTAVVQPVAISQPMPSWAPANSADAGRSFSGQLEVAIDERGNVASAQLAAPIYPLYDDQLLKLARSWRFKPATRGGVPIPFVKVVQIKLQSGPGGQVTETAPVLAQGVPAPAGYVIGPEDVLTVLFWRDKDLSGDVIVRPDGVIALPLINEIVAAGLTPEQLRVKLMEAASQFIEEPNATVVVKQINSRKVYITGMVNKVGAFPLTGPMTVLQLITVAGGLQDFADEENVVVLRTEKGREVSYRFNYKDVIRRKNLAQNIQLLPGDQVVVP